MVHSFHRAMLCMALFATVVPAIAQPSTPEATELRTGKPIERSLNRNEAHRYKARLKRGEMLFLVVDQRGIDIEVRVKSPSGQTLKTVDSPNGTQGPEPVFLIAPDDGEYMFEVAPLDEGQPVSEGRYEIKLVKILKPKASPREQTEQFISFQTRKDAPGAAVAVIQDGKIVYDRGFGSANLEYDIPITPETVFHVASVSKQFTAFSILLLADQGKLSLDDPIQKYLPELHTFDKPVTIRHLIHHTSGIRDQWELLAMAGWRLDDVITQDHIRRMAWRMTELNFEPGSQFLYSNMGYSLLAEIVERVSKKPFTTFTAENIFQPLGMTHTHFHNDHQMLVKNRAYSYSSAGPNSYRLSALNYANVGATSLFTTADDLAKWVMNFDTKKVGGPAVIARMQEVGKLNNGRNLDYAAALTVRKRKGLTEVSHNGADAGYRAEVEYYPEQRFGVVVLSNVADFNPSGFAEQIADFYLADKFTPEPAPVPPFTPTTTSAGTFNISPATLAQYTGIYEVTPTMQMTVSVEGERLMVQGTGQPRVATQAEAENRFFVPQANARLVFERDASGTVDRVTLGPVTAKRIPPFAPDAAQLAEYAGAYYSPELDTTYTLEVKEGKLVAQHPRNEPSTLTPVSTDRFNGNQWYFSGVRFTRDDQGKINGLLVSGGRVRNLRFNRR